VSKMNMDFIIHDRNTIVKSELLIEKNPKLDWDHSVASHDLVLDGDETSITLLEVSLDNRVLKEGEDYTLEKGKMIIKNPPLGSTLRTTVSIIPEDNTQLSGLYQSGSSKGEGMYCTQCEAMGFRRITYYPDRPDNMAIFDRVRLEADKENYPVLLANGNLLEEGDVASAVDDATAATPQRHYAIWSDPYPKPSYLFCCVAGKLGKITDSFTTSPSGREVTLNIYSDPKDAHKLQYAMTSLKASMDWDQTRWGLEYDLDLYNIVAVDSFNMGAMENKGLNVFNTAYVLADPLTATDSDYERVEGVIGHEYFHNWTGNRVTCRDWFQLTLKEGLTVFRDQEFSGDMNSKAVKRIEGVAMLRASQFAQDAGPMSHPIRPESYISMDNFYTATVYNKGAEIIRMYQTIVSPLGFRKGMDLYFARHDGSAVTCDDFLAAMSDANPDSDLSQFSRWYSTPGTPVVTYEYNEYDSMKKQWTVTLTQTSQSTEGPLHIPISIGLLDKGTGKEVVATTVCNLKKETQTFVLDVDDIHSSSDAIVPSILRGFSAPIKLLPASTHNQGKGVDEATLAFLAAHDTDGFQKWESGQALSTSLIFQVMEEDEGIDAMTTSKTWTYVKEAFQRSLENYESIDYSILAYELSLPTQGSLTELVSGDVDPLAIHTARGSVKKALARDFHSQLQKRYDALTAAITKDTDGEFKVDATSMGRRRLRNVCLSYLCSLSGDNEEIRTASSLAKHHYDTATCMTDKVAALTCLASMDDSESDGVGGTATAAREEIIQRFYDEAQGDALVLDKWFSIQAMADLPDILERVQALQQHTDFTLKNPNRCRALVGGFTANPRGFHAIDGSGYQWVREILEELDPINASISSRLSSSLLTWKTYNYEQRGHFMKKELEQLSTLTPISDDLFEIVSKGLK